MTETAPAAAPEGGDDYATWDAPYVLGALDRAERLEYEAHLAQCPGCREAVAELSGMPGLLGQVDAEVALALIDPPLESVGGNGFRATDRTLPEVGSRAADGSLPGGSAQAGTGAATEGAGRSGGAAQSGSAARSESAAQSGAPDSEGRVPGVEEPPFPLAELARRARRERRRGRLLAVTGAVAAAAAAVAIAIPVTASLTEPTAPPTADQVVAERSMNPVVPSPITASFRLVAVNDGTRVEMSCSYAPSSTDYSWQGSLWVVHSDGTQSMVAQWTARPGETVTPDGTTAVPPDQVRMVEIRSATTNQVMLTSSLQ
ncbi:anti-sigma factor family protein [Nocardia mexicana]|uniref:Putative zinc finger protein n=1 Tax=Nocardia mexicana TaxID=279262 RepID=A0A370GUA7_9NOCA|nr:zf-HC2 domain-containing protein [Nocardia mexicana]RDI46816.1 putative zinc finger protein [Nocardia mexicana]